MRERKVLPSTPRKNQMSVQYENFSQATVLCLRQKQVQSHPVPIDSNCIRTFQGVGQNTFILRTDSNFSGCILSSLADGNFQFSSDILRAFDVTIFPKKGQRLI